jgi:putative ubiquitin-RnfH superfamily antitoxin RatB of RatAB toxin-antitoxin module
MDESSIGTAKVPGGSPCAEMHVQVCYARPDAQILVDLKVLAGSSLHQAIARSEVLKRAPEIDLAVMRVGIFGKIKKLETTLRESDRVEIYRPLSADPKESRRKRVDKKDGRTRP